MIPVRCAPKPEWFDEHVAIPGDIAIQIRVGKIPHDGAPLQRTYKCPEEIPTDEFPAIWRRKRIIDGKNTIDHMMDAYGQYCAYLGLRIESGTGSPTIDHFIPISRDWKRVYDWYNYRLCSSRVNSKKGAKSVVDPFEVEHGWFNLTLNTGIVRAGKAPDSKHALIQETLPILNLRGCVVQRREFFRRYLGGTRFEDITYYAPFVAYEIWRQKQLRPEDQDSTWPPNPTNTIPATHSQHSPTPAPKPIPSPRG